MYTAVYALGVQRVKVHYKNGKNETILHRDKAPSISSCVPSGGHLGQYSFMLIHYQYATKTLIEGPYDMKSIEGDRYACKPISEYSVLGGTARGS